MARTDTTGAQLTSGELALVQSLGNLAVSGASEAVRKSGSSALANVSVGGTSINFAFSETPSGTINGTDGTDGNATFTIANTPTAGTLALYKNGTRMNAGAGNDYTLSGTTITFNSGAIPISGDVLLSDYQY